MGLFFTDPNFGFSSCFQWAIAFHLIPLKWWLVIVDFFWWYTHFRCQWPSIEAVIWNRWSRWCACTSCNEHWMGEVWRRRNLCLESFSINPQSFFFFLSLPQLFLSIVEAVCQVVDWLILSNGILLQTCFVRVKIANLWFPTESILSRSKWKDELMTSEFALLQPTCSSPKLESKPAPYALICPFCLHSPYSMVNQ